MVNSARAEAAQSEKLLKEANGKIEVLQAEVKALKELVLNTSNSNSSTPNKGSQRLTVKANSHSRQSSLNQQAFSHLIPAPSSTSTPSSSNVVQAASSTHSLVNGSGAGKQSSAGMKHSTSSLQPLSLSMGRGTTRAQSPVKDGNKHHRRMPSDQAKSFIDKLFHTSSGSLNSSSGSHKSEKKLLSKFCAKFISFQISKFTEKKTLKKKEEKSESLEKTGSIEVNNVYEQEAVEHDTIYYDELVNWRQKPELTANSSPFLARIYTEDILPCLSFSDSNVIYFHVLA